VFRRLLVLLGGLWLKIGDWQIRLTV